MSEFRIIVLDNLTPATRAARQILCKYEINPYTGCENLAYSKLHCHSDQYAVAVYNALARVENDGKGKVAKVLSELAKQHRNCKFPPILL